MTIRLNQNQELSLKERFLNLNFLFIAIIIILAYIGCLTLYSVAGAQLFPWAANQAARFGIGLIIMFSAALIQPEIYYKIATPFYIFTLILLVIVDAVGHIGMGAQRWINLGFFNLQPSELMKIAVVLQLSKYFSTVPLESIKSIKGIIIPIILVAVPVVFIMIQPDLGTSLMILFCAVAMFYLAGVQWWKFALAIGSAIASAPLLWHFLHDYQKNRILTFLDPEKDPLNTGYNIIQAKIALGSGGLWGKGFLSGTQSHLRFLPESHTDFIFATFSEEFGMIGGSLVLFLNLILITYGYWFAFRIHHNNYFGKMVILGLNTNYFLYIFINIAIISIIYFYWFYYKPNKFQRKFYP